MKFLLLLPLLATVAHAEKLAQADLTKLNDPDQALAEVTRITIGADSESYQLIGYHFLKARQVAGKPPLHVLCGERKYLSHFSSSDDYAVDKPEEIFGNEQHKGFAQLLPTLDRIEDSALFIFDNKGKEIRPFGGNNYIDGGYLFDFDGDGILDRADSTNYGIAEAPKHDVEMFELLTVEPKPRELLKVIFNWHPRSADDANEWTFRCTDTDADGRPEIRFGPRQPRDGENADAYVFQWDAAAGKFSAGKIPKGSHILVMEKSDTLKSVAAAGGLGYPLLGDSPPKDSPAIAISHQKPYAFNSFAELSDKELAAFFKGKDRRDAFDGAEGSFPDKIPDGLFALEPKQAALALAEANRTQAHRNDFQLAIDDRNGIAPAAAGWAQYSWSSAGCYSFSSELFAIRFGVADPVLLNFGYNSIGVVGRNPWADQPAHSARIVKISEKEATFLAETLFWLDRVRSKSLRGEDDGSFSHNSSSADGHSRVSIFASSGAAKQLTSATDWATSSISGKWNENYNREVFANLAGLLIRQGVPQMLQDRWERNQHPGHHSLRTPTEERLRDRLGAETRKKLEADLAAVLAMDSTNNLPPDVIRNVAEAAGNEALLSLLPTLEQKLTALPAKSSQEKECAVLEKRFERDHFGSPLADKPQEHKDAYQRLIDLREQLRFTRTTILREPMTDAVEKLRLAADSKLLQQAVIKKSPHTQWALSLLRRTEPATWASLVAADFARAETEERQTILSTIAAGHPPAAAAMISDFTKKERSELILEIADYHKIHAPDALQADVPLLIALATDRKQDVFRRGEAMERLATLQLATAQLDAFTKLLLDEIKNPQKGEYFSGTLGYSLMALAALPNPEKHLDFVLSLTELSKNDFNAAFHAIEAMTRANPQRVYILANFLRTQFVASEGMMNDHFIKALAYDLRPLTAEIAAFASESPKVEDGDGANYSGGNFKTPVGQRYHIAREITALWSEKDPQTLARTWIALIASRPHDFQSHDEPNALRDLATKHIRNLPQEQRKTRIQAILSELPIHEYYADTRAWVNSLAE